MIRVFIGTEAAQEVPTEVLKHSILSRTKEEVEFVDLREMDTGLEGRFYTNFSFYRWSIPQRCGFEGRAIYLDADVLALCDIKELWDFDLAENSHACRRVENGISGGYFTSVMIIDCAKANWPFSDWCKKAAGDKKQYSSIMWCRNGAESMKGLGTLPREFNSMDHGGYFDSPIEKAKFLHYTIVPNQPWRFPRHKNGVLWYKELVSLVQSGKDLGTQILNAETAGNPYHAEVLASIQQTTKGN